MEIFDSTPSQTGNLSVSTFLNLKSVAHHHIWISLTFVFCCYTVGPAKTYFFYPLTLHFQLNLNLSLQIDLRFETVGWIFQQIYQPWSTSYVRLGLLCVVSFNRQRKKTAVQHFEGFFITKRSIIYDYIYAKIILDLEFIEGIIHKGVGL